LVDTHLREFGFHFELHGTEISQCGVHPPRIVETLDVIAMISAPSLKLWHPEFPEFCAGVHQKRNLDEFRGTRPCLSIQSNLSKRKKKLRLDIP
jgi:hypothetical protein